MYSYLKNIRFLFLLRTYLVKKTISLKITKKTYHSLFSVQEDKLLELDVSHDNTVLVTVVDGLHALSEDVARLGLGQTLLLLHVGVQIAVVSLEHGVNVVGTLLAGRICRGAGCTRALARWITRVARVRTHEKLAEAVNALGGAFHYEIGL